MFLKAGTMYPAFLDHPDVLLPPTHEGELHMCWPDPPVLVKPQTSCTHSLPTSAQRGEVHRKQLMIPQHDHASNPNKIITDVVTHLKNEFIFQISNFSGFLGHYPPEGLWVNECSAYSPSFSAPVMLCYSVKLVHNL